MRSWDIPTVDCYIIQKRNYLNCFCWILLLTQEPSSGVFDCLLSLPCIAGFSTGTVIRWAVCWQAFLHMCCAVTNGGLTATVTTLFRVLRLDGLSVVRPFYCRVINEGHSVSASTLLRVLRLDGLSIVRPFYGGVTNGGHSVSVTSLLRILRLWTGCLRTGSFTGEWRMKVTLTQLLLNFDCW